MGSTEALNGSNMLLTQHLERYVPRLQDMESALNVHFTEPLPAMDCRMTSKI